MIYYIDTTDMPWVSVIQEKPSCAFGKAIYSSHFHQINRLLISLVLKEAVYWKEAGYQHLLLFDIWFALSISDPFASVQKSILKRQMP